MKPGGALVAKIIDIDLQHTPTARLCLPRAIRSKKSEAWFHEFQNMHKSYFLAFSFHPLDSGWLTSSLSSIHPPNMSPRINASLSSRNLEVFQTFLKIRQARECPIHSVTHGV